MRLDDVGGTVTVCLGEERLGSLPFFFDHGMYGVKRFYGRAVEYGVQLAKRGSTHTGHVQNKSKVPYSLPFLAVPLDHHEQHSPPALTAPLNSSLAFNHLTSSSCLF